MRWQVKSFVQAVLSRMPYHKLIYRKLHSNFGKASQSLGDQLDRKIGLIKRMKSSGHSIEDKTYLEIGTGWHPVLPLLLHLSGARRVVTLDLNPWLTRTTLEVTVDGIEREIERVANGLCIPAIVLLDRFAAVKKAMSNEQNSPTAILNSCSIEYHMPGDASATRLPMRSIDCIISANVLEHVPKSVIVAIFTEAHRLLRPDGMMFHHINPGDHFAQDKRITTANFLRYSTSAWYFIGGSGVAYHNRLRCVDYLRLIEDSDFEIAGTYSDTDAAALAQLKSGVIRIHPDFKEYTEEQLACYIIGVFARPLQAMMKTKCH